MATGRKTGGRIAGTPNTATKVNRECLQGILDGQCGKIEEELAKLTGKEYLTAIINLMEFVIPKMQRQQSELQVQWHPQPVAPIVTIITAADE